ncbi:MAG: flagellar export chaperone FliS [Desulfovibrio sp.]|uniref:flagellar export chaperone FliS n=1 Tax=Desulfovibrio sp. TaxID=885 RepID=UPI0025C6F89C|nr:flagellar export chaperone FliS [Desulfovibrio sp.]MCI7568557.1 flagellar export chaperone FliS [Desulfovibrio sp.]
MNNKAAQAYIQTKVGTTDQGQLLLMLYDGALRFLQQAREKMLAKDYAGKGLYISKALDIIGELSSSLNMEKGGELATNLNNLYFLCMARLLDANLKMNVERLDSVCEILSGLRSAYAQIIDTPEARNAAEQIVRSRPAEAGAIRRAPLAPTVNNHGAMPGASRAQASMAYGKSAGAFANPLTSVEGQTAAGPAASPAAQPMEAAQLGGSSSQMRRVANAYGKGS